MTQATAVLNEAQTLRVEDIIKGVLKNHLYEPEDKLAECAPTGKENIELLSDVLDYADFETERARKTRKKNRFNMKTWVMGKVVKTEEGTPPPMPCGTSACLAGTATAFTMKVGEIMFSERVGKPGVKGKGWQPFKIIEYSFGAFAEGGETIEQRGRRVLGLTEMQSMVLFRTFDYKLPDIRLVATYMTGVDLKEKTA